MADTPSDDIGSEDAPGEDAPESLPDASGNEAVPKEDVPEEAVADEAFADEAVADETVASGAFADEAFAEDIAGAEDFSEKALSERTRRAYRRAWADFETYCEEVGKDPLPARPVTVAAYLIVAPARGPPGGAPRRSAPARAWTPRPSSSASPASSTSTSRADVPSPTTHPQVSQVMQGIRNDTGRQEALPKTEAAPLVSSDLKQALQVLPGSGAQPPRSETAKRARWLRGLRDRALLLLGFATALRPRELVSIEKKHVAREASGTKGGPAAEGLIVHIPRSKADQEAQGQTVTALKNEASPTYCPVRALSRWRRAARVEEGPLFRGVRRDGAVLPEAISYRTLNRLVQRACRKAGLEPEGFSSTKRRRYSAHSLRAGHVTDASSHGAPDNVLMTQTRHEDPKTLRRYDRPAQQLEESSSGFLGLYQE